MTLGDLIRRCSRAEIACKAHDVSPGRRFHLGNRLIHGGLRAAIHYDARALPGQTGGDGASDAGSAATDQRAFTLKFQVHGYLR
jgi:hypothetical protein